MSVEDYRSRVVGYIDRKTQAVRRAMDEELDNEEFEILDVRDRNWLHKALRDISQAPVAKQVAVGTVSGWCSGYLSAKVGKAAALALGGSLLIMQVAHHQGYITVNWSKLQKNLQNAQRRIEQNTNRRLPAIFDQIRDFAVQNAFLAGGFAGGFLIGLAS